jgi:hypothetical protein
MRGLFEETRMHIRASLATDDGTGSHLGKHLTYVVLLLPILQHHAWSRLCCRVTLGPCLDRFGILLRPGTLFVVDSGAVALWCCSYRIPWLWIIGLAAYP